MHTKLKTTSSTTKMTVILAKKKNAIIISGVHRASLYLMFTVSLQFHEIPSSFT